MLRFMNRSDRHRHLPTLKRKCPRQKSGSSIYIRDSDLREPSDGIPRCPSDRIVEEISDFPKKYRRFIFPSEVFSHDALIYTPTEETRFIPSEEKFLKEGIVLPRGVLYLRFLPFAPDAVPAPISRRRRIARAHSALQVQPRL